MPHSGIWRETREIRGFSLISAGKLQVPVSHLRICTLADLQRLATSLSLSFETTKSPAAFHCHAASRLKNNQFVAVNLATSLTPSTDFFIFFSVASPAASETRSPKRR
jgi:hypothetical protein